MTSIPGLLWLITFHKLGCFCVNYFTSLFSKATQSFVVWPFDISWIAPQTRQSFLKDCEQRRKMTQYRHCRGQNGPSGYCSIPKLERRILSSVKLHTQCFFQQKSLYGLKTVPIGQHQFKSRMSVRTYTFLQSYIHYTILFCLLLQSRSDLKCDYITTLES